MNYQMVKRQVLAVLPGDLAMQAMAFAKGHASTKRPRTSFPGLSPTANIVLLLVLEYVLLEIVDLSREAARKRGRVFPRHVRIAVLHDDELKRLVSNPTVLFSRR